MTRDATSFDIPPAEKTKKLKYPKSVFFIVSNEFCERFCFYGMRTILVLYLVQYLKYDSNTATVVYHAFVCVAYLTPLIGAMIADSWLGRFNTIFFLSIIYAVGSIILSLAAMPDILPAEPFTYVGLVLIAFGTGGIKPCVSAFGGDQFVVPEQERKLQQFFSVFYFSVNGGSLLSTFITPILREDVKCFGFDGCYPLAFGVPAILMVVSILIFIAGRPLYKMKKPEGNVVLTVSKCISHAISKKMKSKGEKKEHWLDFAEEKFGPKMIEDIKGALRVLVLFLPLPIFWALFDQQGSRWTFQATRMDGDFGGFTIKPDQIQVFNPALVLILIPLFEAGIYPLFKKFNILQKPLHKMIFGGGLAAVAFVVSALVELAITPTLAIIPGAGEAQLRIYNSINCPLSVTLTGSLTDTKEISPLNVWEMTHLAAQGNKEFVIDVTPGAGCPAHVQQASFTGNFRETKALSYLLYDDVDVANSGLKLLPSFEEDLQKSDNGNAKLRVLYNIDITSGTKITFKNSQQTEEFDLIGSGGKTTLEEFDAGVYAVTMGAEDLGTVVLRNGGVYSFIVEQRGTSYSNKLKIITQENSVNILWQIPQYIIITSGEVMFSITGLEFAFTQAALSMKSLLTAGWLLTVAFGNIIVIIIAEAKFVENPMWEFVLFACLMAAFMVLFFFMSMRYKYVTVSSEEPDTDIALEKKEKSEKSHENGAYDAENEHKD